MRISSAEELRPRGGSRRPTLGLITNALSQNYYAQAIIDAADEAAERAGFDLVVFVAGHYLEGDLRSPTNRTLLGALRAGWFDALIALPVGPHLKVSELDAFYKTLRGTPVCSVAATLPSFPSVVVGGEEGARETIDHLIRVHGRKRIALLRGVDGTEEYDERFRGWMSAFRANGLEPDPALILTTEAYGPQGGEAVRLLIGERHAPIDALVTANDAMALDAIRELRRLEARVPRDIAVCGFDDAPEARHASPPLTTVRQPLQELGQRAVETVLAALRGETVPARQVLQARLLVRQSCGCVRHAVKNRGVSDAPEAPVVSSAHRVSVTPSTRPAHRPLPVVTLQESLRADVNSATGEFLGRFRAVLEDAAVNRGEVGDAHDLLTRLRTEELLRISGDSARRDRLEDLIHAARILVSEIDVWALVEDRARVYWWALKLNRSSEAFTTSLTMAMLMDRFQTGIHEFDIPRCAVALFEGGDLAPEEASIALAYDATKKIESLAVHARFRCADHLLPVDLWEHDRRRVYVVECIHGRLDVLHDDNGRSSDLLGYAVFEMGPRDGLVYQCLRDQISAAIKGLGLWQRLLGEVERRQSAERVYERMASLGRLTAGIAHGMNTPVAAVRAALQHMAELADEYRAGIGDAEVTLTDHREIASEMSTAITAASSAAVRVSEFVKSMRLQTREAPLTEARWFDVVAVVHETLLLLDHAIRAGHCVVQVVAGDEPVELSGDPARFSQLLSNLVTNAVEASATKNGDEIVVAVTDKDGGVELSICDHGEGILPENVSRVFDPMFTTRGFGDHSGLGLSIAHDIVTGTFGGTIEVESVRGKGSTFTVRLPRAGVG